MGALVLVVSAVPRPVAARVQVVGSTIEAAAAARTAAPWVKALPLAGGGFVVLWPSQQGPQASPFDQAGQPLAAPFPLPSTGVPAATTVGDTLVVATGDNVLWIGLDGVVQHMQSNHAPPFTRSSTLAAAASGTIELLWDFIDPIGVYAAAFAADGAVQSYVVTDSSVGNSWPAYPAAAGLADDQFLNGWVAENSGAIWARRTSAAGVVGDSFNVASGLDAPTGPALCADASSASGTVAWHTDAPIQFRRIDASGALLTDVLCSELQGEASVACPQSGVTLLVGDLPASDESPQFAVVVRAFDAHGAPRGHVAIALRDTLPAATSAAALVGGDTAVAWSDCDPSGVDGCRIRAQVVRVDDVGSCQGDCNDDGRVTVDELVTGVDLALTEHPSFLRCPALKQDLRSCAVGISDVVGAVAHALRGCS